MEQIVSKFNGLSFTKHPGVSDANWAFTKKQLQETEGSRLFSVGTPVAQKESPSESGKSFAIPQNAAIEFEADKIKAEKKRGRPAKQDDSVVE